MMGVYRWTCADEVLGLLDEFFSGLAVFGLDPCEILTTIIAIIIITIRIIKITII